MEHSPDVVGKPESASEQSEKPRSGEADPSIDGAPSASEQNQGDATETKEPTKKEVETRSEDDAPTDEYNMFSEDSKDESNNSDNQAESEEGEGDPQGEWYLSEGVKGEGEPPDWFISNKYKSVADQAKAVKELRNEYNKMKDKMGEFQGAPEKYDFDKLPAEIDKSSPMLERFQGVFKNLGMSQQAFESIAGEFVNMQMEQAQVSPSQVIKEAGPEGKQVFDRVSTWARNSFSPEEQAMLTQVCTSGGGLQLLDKIRANTRLSTLPTHKDFAGATPNETSQQVKAEKRANMERYMSDQNYAKEISGRLQTALMYEGKSNKATGRR